MLLCVAFFIMDLTYLGSANHSCKLLRPCSKIYTNKNVMTEVFWDVTLCVTGCEFFCIQRIVVLSFGWSSPRRIAKGTYRGMVDVVADGHGGWSVKHQATASLNLCKSDLYLFLLMVSDIHNSNSETGKNYYSFICNYCAWKKMNY